MDSVDAVVVGAGVVGLAVARALAYRGHETLVLEANDQFGTEVSSRNSEVIHAGIYYPKNSLKARLCVAGRDSLYAFCEQHGVGHRRCGKLIVATREQQLADLDGISYAAGANGVEVWRLSRAEALAVESELNCVGALYSPATGIIDSHAYMLALLGQAESRGATLACNSRVTRMWLDPAGASIAINADAPTLRARYVVNCAGLRAPEVAHATEGLGREHIPPAFFVKGNYFSLIGRSPFRRLVYPVPEPGGLGVHLTLDLAGRARFGPDVQWVHDSDYGVDRQRAEHFYDAIREYWPGLADGALQPAYAGMRPRITGPTQPAADFRIDGPEVHGITGLVNLFGIESPGLTASLAIAEHVAELVDS
jgi:L-2-hydroxyglutarate oxidase LhgO